MEYTLASDSIALTVRPDLGGRIDQVTDRRTGKDWLWHPAWYEGKSRTLPLGASFDEHWSGGWDEVFPNDAACTFRGRQLHDHGELWSQPWQVVAPSRSMLVLKYACSTVPVEAEKAIFVRDGEIRIRYLFENLSDRPLPFLFKLHPALAIEPGDEICLPPCSIEPVDTGFSTIIGKASPTPFPTAFDGDGKEVQVNVVPGPEAQKQEFFYATALSEGWCGLRNHRTGTALTMTFDRAHIPYVWVFQSYGQWRSHYVLMLEPCTNVPYDLNTALLMNTCAVLAPEERREMTISVSLQRNSVE